MECMIGCMLEAKISVNAAVELACAKKIITKIDLDGPVLCSEDHILGGAVFDEKNITVSDAPVWAFRALYPARCPISTKTGTDRIPKHTGCGLFLWDCILCTDSEKSSCLYMLK